MMSKVYYPAGNILRFDPALTIEEVNISYLLDCLDSIMKKQHEANG